MMVSVVLISRALMALFALIMAYYVAIYLSTRWMLRKFKGPFPIPLLGNCYHASALFFLRYLVTLRKRYGQIFTFFAFTKPYLVICDPTVVRRILSDSKTFYKGTDYTEQFSAAFGQGLVTANGDKHKHDRSLFGKLFIRSNVAKYTGLMNSFAEDAVDQLLENMGDKPRAYNIEHFFARLALRVFMSFSIGFNYKNDPKFEDQICSSVSTGSNAVGRVIAIGLPMWNWIPFVKQINEARATVLRDFDAVVKKRREMLKSCSEEDRPNDALTLMIEDNMSESDMRDHFMTLICAGHDTTAYFSSYLCYLLAQHPKVQDQVVDEINRVMGDRTEITADDVAEMKYISKVMQETLRLYSIIPAVTRTAGEEVVIKEAGVTIPKGTNVMVPMFLINRDPAIWESPGDFNPERFSGAGEWTSAKNGYFPFGYGVRTCIGNTLAQMESIIFMCKLLRKFRLQPDPGFKLSIMSGISLTTANGINIMLKKL